MDDEFEQFGFKHFIASVAVVVFTAGALWAGSQGLEVALNGGGSNTANVSDSSSMASTTPTPSTTIPASSRTSAVSNPSAVTGSNSPTLTIMMGGDVMFDRHIRLLGMNNGYDRLLAPAADLFKSADIAVVNLEGPITSNPSKTLLANGETTKALSFTFATDTAPVLARANIALVSLANNHADNMGYGGFAETKKWLDAAGVGYFGSPWNSSSTEAVVTRDGITVAFVGYHAFQPGIDRILADVRKLSSEGDLVVVMPHWGDEYVASSSPLLQKEAREFVAAGAGAVIGSHPHVVMDHEWLPSADGHGTVPVYYSLGNLLFDQYFSPAVMNGNVVALIVSKGADGAAHVTGVKVYDTKLDPKNGMMVDADSIGSAQ